MGQLRSTTPDWDGCVKTDHLRHIREYWNGEASDYANAHPEHLDETCHPSWGLFNIPEHDIRILVEDLAPGDRVLDLGCGRGQDAVGYAEMGMDVTAIDISDGQLANAIAHERVTYVHSSAEKVPVPSGHFEAVFSDHGAFDHSPARPLLDEVHRVLKPNGVLAICTYTPLAICCYDSGKGRIGEQLQRRYPDDDIKFNGKITAVERSYAGWITAFLATGFEIVGLEELKVRPESRPFFSDLISTEWASKWPCDLIWKVRRCAP